jgi:metal iron transporter
MNCPSRTEEPLENDGWNQNPPGLAADLTTREDLNGLVNSRTQRDSDSRVGDGRAMEIQDRILDPHPPWNDMGEDVKGKSNVDVDKVPLATPGLTPSSLSVESSPGTPPGAGFLGRLQSVGNVLTKFTKFIGPGFMVSVAYIDPGNYSTDVAAGASTKFKLLFIVLMSNVFAIILQSLAIRLGSITGLNLAEHCRAHLPRWLNLLLYVLGEGAIIATDIAEVGILLNCLN